MWYSINNVEPETISELVLNESIWLNERILVGNVPIHNKTWIKAGILTIKDCLNGNSFMSQAQLMGKYKVPCDFLLYNGLRSSILRRWLDLLATTNDIDKFIVEKPQTLMVKLNNNKYVEFRKVTCRQFYWGEIKIISERPTCYFKWESEYFFADFDWDAINIIPYECTSDTYLQSIQYKIIHRYFPCKYQLNTWNVEDSNKCTYCLEIDTLSHYFVECESVCGFWNSLKAWFLRTFEFCIKFTVLDILLGIPNHGKNKDIIKD